MAMLSAMFMLLTMLAYLQGRIALEAGKRRRGLVWLLVAAPLFTLLACLSKENGILAPALCAMIEWIAFVPRKYDSAIVEQMALSGALDPDSFDGSSIAP